MSLGPTTGQEPADPGSLPISHNGDINMAPPLIIPNDLSATTPHAASSTLDIQDMSDKPNKMGDSAPLETDGSALSELPLFVSVSDQPSAQKESTSSALDEPGKEPDSEDAKPSSNVKTDGEAKSDSEAEVGPPMGQVDPDQLQPSAKVDGKRKAPAGETLKRKRLTSNSRVANSSLAHAINSATIANTGLTILPSVFGAERQPKTPLPRKGKTKVTTKPLTLTGITLTGNQHCLDCIHHDLKCVIPPSYLPLLEAYITHVKEAVTKKNFSGSFWHPGSTRCGMCKASNKPPCMVGILVQELGPGYHSRNIISIMTFPVPANPSIKPVKSVKPATSCGSKSKIKSKQIVEDSDPEAESEDDKNVDVEVTPKAKKHKLATESVYVSAPPRTVTAPTHQASAGPSGVSSFSSISSNPASTRQASAGPSGVSSFTFISPVPAPTFDAAPIVDAINMLQVTSLLYLQCLRYLLVLPLMEAPKPVLDQVSVSSLLRHLQNLP
ncbi:hypothetical protein BDZ97DRAFT_1921436 [Flammula alnicola]|nr:hypothetical protein BDZ97DRAFT_1921436 [Flammula alnicola]